MFPCSVFIRFIQKARWNNGAIFPPWMCKRGYGLVNHQSECVRTYRSLSSVDCPDPFEEIIWFRKRWDPFITRHLHRQQRNTCVMTQSTHTGGHRRHERQSKQTCTVATCQGQIAFCYWYLSVRTTPELNRPKVTFAAMFTWCLLCYRSAAIQTNNK